MDDRHSDYAALQRALSRLALIADLSEALTATLDAQEGLERVCRILAQRLGDWCAIDLVTDQDMLERACASSRDHAAERTPGTALPRPSPDATGALAAAFRHAKPVLLGTRDIVMLPRTGPWETSLADDLARHDATSAILVPLRARRDERREVLGVICVARSGDHPALGDPEIAILHGLAHRVALALDNARLHADTERIAERLQRSLLPTLPRISGVTLAARYLPSSTAAQVGGDWYDAFPLPAGSHALIVGDVVGHDLRAAVAMSQVRSVLRGIACDRQEPPESIIRRLDTATATLYPNTYASCVYAVLREDPEENAWYVDYTSAGHPPPLLIEPSGAIRFLEEGHGPLIGVDPKLMRTSATARLQPGATLLLYTDGLVERRTEPLDHGLTRLRRHAASLASLPPGTLCDRLLAALAPDGTDDVALLAARLATPGSAGKSSAAA